MDKNYEAVRRILLATNKIDGVYYLFAKNSGAGENTLAFLYALSDGLPHSQKEISDEWLIPRTTINSIVKNMLADGYIKLSAAHNKEKDITLTKKGMKYADSLMDDIYAAEEKAIKKTLKKYPKEFIEGIEDFGNNLYEEFLKINS